MKLSLKKLSSNFYKKRKKILNLQKANEKKKKNLGVMTLPIRQIYCHYLIEIFTVLVLPL